jgi:hypothetical protein
MITIIRIEFMNLGQSQHLILDRRFMNSKRIAREMHYSTSGWNASGGKASGGKALGE